MRSHVGLQMRTFKVGLAASWVATDVTSYPRWVNLRSDFRWGRGKPGGRGNGRESGAIWAHHRRLWVLNDRLGHNKHDGALGHLSAHEHNRWADSWRLTGRRAGDDCRHDGVVCREGNHLADDRHRGHSRCGHCGWRDQDRLLWGRGGRLRSADDGLWGRHGKVIKCSGARFLFDICLCVSLTFGPVWWHSGTRYIFSCSLRVQVGSFPKWIVLIVEDAGCFHGARSVVTQLGISCMTNHTGCLSLGEFGGRYRVLLLFERYSSNVRLGSIWQWFEVSSRWRWCHQIWHLRRFKVRGTVRWSQTLQRREIQSTAWRTVQVMI